MLTKSRSRRDGQENVGQGNENKRAGKLGRSRFPRSSNAAPHGFTASRSRIGLTRVRYAFAAEQKRVVAQPARR